MSADPRSDPFAPPEISTEVCCLHCGETYDSWQIEWRMMPDNEGGEHGFWCCPIPGCNGMGFGCDILPTDPHYRDERGGWVYDDDAEWSESDDDEPEWSEIVELSDGAEAEEIPWDDSPPTDQDFPFSAN